MEEQLISFKTAKLAKEKGFNIKDNYLYRWYNEKGTIHQWMYLKTNEQIEFVAPTQSLLQKWLIKVHTIDVVALPVRFQGYLEIGYWTYSVSGIQPVKNYRYETLEEALEVGLLEGLKLIKNV